MLEKIYKGKEGFTLIELLVVIAIIGLLATVVITATSATRAKGKDAAVQSNLNTVRSEAELFYVNSPNGYGSPVANSSACNTGVFASGSVAPALSAATEAGALNAATERRCIIGQNGDSWAVSIPLAGGGSWCVASIGSGGSGVATGGGVGAPASCQ